MNKRKSGLQKIKNFRDPPFRTISKSNQNHNTPGRSEKSMIKLYEESELKRLTTSEIDRMKDDTVFIQISETKFERKKRS